MATTATTEADATIDTTNLTTSLTTDSFETERLVLRPWTLDDAEDCYNYCKDPRIGPSSGWEPHKDVEYSKEMIKKYFFKPNIYAVCFKDDPKLIGCIGLYIGKESGVKDVKDDEGEIGYWLGVDFWGRGIIPEAVRRLQKHAFEDLGLKDLWGRHFVFNTQSGRVLEKCGFVPKEVIDEKNGYTGEILKTRVLFLGKEQWEELNKK